jgi:hypothetical protein
MRQVSCYAVPLGAARQRLLHHGSLLWNLPVKAGPRHNRPWAKGGPKYTGSRPGASPKSIRPWPVAGPGTTELQAAPGLRAASGPRPQPPFNTALGWVLRLPVLHK